jgi:hypothetical protein
MSTSTARVACIGASLFLCAIWLVQRCLPPFTAALPEAQAAPAAAADSSGAAMLHAAQRLIESLSPEEKAQASFAFDDKERFNWHFIPRERKGLKLKSMGGEQRGRLQDLIWASLSRAGVQRVNDVRGLESILAAIEGPSRRFERDPELYFLSVFGAPGPKAKWGWRLEGHHLCLNFTLEGEAVLSATPLFFGANPALVRDGPKKGARILAGMEDVARELAKSLDREQLGKALGEGPPAEVEGHQTEKYPGPYPTGIPAASLNESQKALLKRLIGEYTQALSPDVREAVHGEIAASDHAKVQFVWRGGLEMGQGHSYMVHGPTFVISYANFQNDAYHVHSAFRELRGEFGLE